MDESAARLLSRSQRGSVTAELAAAVPAVFVLLAACLLALTTGVAHVRLSAATAEAARAYSRGDSARASEVVARAVPGARVGLSREGALVCASSTATVTAARVAVHARVCAMQGDE